MGRERDFEEENRTKSDVKFPKLKLEKKDDKARIFCVEKPFSEYVHELRAVKVVNGVPQVIKKTRKRDGVEEEYEDYKMDWLSSPVCLGDEGILDDKGSDPDNCPMCKAAKEGEGVFAPNLKFAMHVIQYNTQHGSHDVVEPLSVQVKVWTFTEKVFNKLITLKKEAGGDLKKVDLLLTCTNGEFNQFDMMPSMRCEARATESNLKLIVDTFKNNKAEDITVFCGQKRDKSRIMEDLAKIRATRAITYQLAPVVNVASPVSQGNAAASPVAVASLADGLDDLLNTSPDTAAADAVSGNGNGNGPDIMAELAARAEDVGISTEVEEVALAKPGSSGEVMDLSDLDDLLNAN